MKYIVSSEEMRQIDKFCIDRIGIPSMVLMERAALSVFHEIKNRIPKDKKCLVIVGSGNNGADGLALARNLLEYGYNTSVRFIGNIEKVSKEWEQQNSILEYLGVNILNECDIAAYDVIVDGLFGVGLSREISSGYFEFIEKMNNNSKAFKIALDIPSGINATTGKVMGIAFQADLTVTFGMNKRGLLLLDGRKYSGEIVVADIGFPNMAIKKNIPNMFHYELSDLDKVPKRKEDSNKGTYGKVFIMAGSKNMAGACYLSAKAAYCTGCGLVKILTHESNRTILQTLLPEAILVTYEGEKQALQYVKDGLAWANAIVIGPGLGANLFTKEMVKLVIEHSNLPTVIDADAIRVLEIEEENRSLKMRKNLILTPHLKEMANLIQEDVAFVKNNLLEVAIQFVRFYNVVLVLKDSRTIVASKDEPFYLNISGNDGMSTGGSGDVLTGIIASFIAQGLDEKEAARIGVYLHGLAGDEAKKEKGSYSMLAQDIINGICKIIK